VIGIDKYPFSPLLPTLQAAVADASTLATVLKNQGFIVFHLYDDQATKQAILKVQTDLAQKVTKEDRMLVFFAGLGHTEQAHGEVRGYLVPYDGTKDIGSYISLEELYKHG
jgi:uncharacterized caspase-like protein